MLTISHGKDVPLEREIQAQIIGWLRRRPRSFTVKLAAGPYMLPGLPDILHIENGVPYFFEVKRPHPGSRVTALQAGVMEKLMYSGANVSVVRSLEDVKIVLNLEVAPC